MHNTNTTPIVERDTYQKVTCAIEAKQTDESDLESKNAYSPAVSWAMCHDDGCKNSRARFANRKTLVTMPSWWRFRAARSAFSETIRLDERDLKCNEGVCVADMSLDSRATSAFTPA